MTLPAGHSKVRLNHIDAVLNVQNEIVGFLDADGTMSAIPSYARSADGSVTDLVGPNGEAIGMVKSITNPLTGGNAFSAGGEDLGVLTKTAISNSVLRSDGAASFSGADISIPAMTVCCGDGQKNIIATTLTTSLPSATVFNVAAGTPTYPASSGYLAMLAITVTNTSGGTVSGNITINGNDERGYWLFDVVSSGSVLNGNSATVNTNKYFASITSVTVSGSLGNAGVAISGVEYQFRGHVKVDTHGSLEFAWNHTYASGELMLLTYEARSAGIISMLDWRSFGPSAPSQRRGSEVLPWIGGLPHGPKDWLGMCMYSACELMDGSVIVAGNSAYTTIFDRQEWGAHYIPGSLTSTQHIYALLDMGLDPSGAEIVYARAEP